MKKIFHLGHEFSSGMPEIKSVKGRPLADLIYSPKCDPTKLSDEAFIERFELAIKALSDDDIDIQAPYESDSELAKANGDEPTSRKDYLMQSFSSFADSIT